MKVFFCFKKQVNLLKPSKTLTDQPNTRPNHSTVEENPTLVNTDIVIGNNITSNKIKNNNRSYYLTMEVILTSSNLWLSHYSDYQMELYSIISDFHDNHNMTFKQISDYLIDKGYKTPRGYPFTHKHTWSIYTKKNRSDQSFEIKIKKIILNQHETPTSEKFTLF